MMPKEYTQPGEVPNSQGLTHYQVFVGPGTIFEPKNQGGGAAPPLGLPGPNSSAPESGRGIMDITDGSSNTILIAVGRNPVPWTKPDDLVFTPNGPLPPLGARPGKVFNVALADGSVRPISPAISDATLRAAITSSGNELLGPDW
jgi:hypothetical protein